MIEEEKAISTLRERLNKLGIVNWYDIDTKDLEHINYINRILDTVERINFKEYANIANFYKTFTETVHDKCKEKGTCTIQNFDDCPKCKEFMKQVKDTEKIKKGE